MTVIGVPKERKNNENRVALTPAGAGMLAARGHTVLVESGAGAGFHEHGVPPCGQHPRSRRR